MVRVGVAVKVTLGVALGLTVLVELPVGVLVREGVMVGVELRMTPVLVGVKLSVTDFDGSLLRFDYHLHIHCHTV